MLWFSRNILRPLKGKNLFGKIGLFPQSYTTSDPSVVQNPAPPQPNGQESATPAPLHTLNEEAEGTSTPEKVEKAEGQGVMRATMTDVQEAIEQLGRNNRDGNGSFSFASSHTDTDRDTDTEVKSTTGDLDGEAWHKDARSALAEKARRQQELLRREQEAYDAELQRMTPVLTDDMVEPPIQFELSDESEDEEEEGLDRGLSANTLFPRREHEHISEEDEDDEISVRQKPNDRPITPKASSLSSKRSRSSKVSIPEQEAPPETARQIYFPTETSEQPHPENKAEKPRVRRFHYLPSELLLNLCISLPNSL